ncbi:PQQ-binding-like beta-propeller repeat protein [Actinoplanes sp. NPDC051633]|uniref:outer membrane protein assembly factor BamB family protein n=1 Tax=Actinoplanes sp. NPDC051633 TaxID=3155670 RepID=UPI00343784A9
MRRLLLALVLVVATGLIGWRVLRPTDLLSPGAVPPGDRPAAGVTGRTASPPLLVDGRLRVFASKRQVRADGPISLKTMYTPSWSFRRWPAQVSGVVAAGATVVSRWSDGQLVAIDGLTGRALWRASGPPAGGFIDARTAVWSPPGFSATAGAVLVSSRGRVSAFAAATGAKLWDRPSGEVPLRSAGATGPITGPFEITADRHLVIRSASGVVTADFPLKTTQESSLDWKPGGWQLAGNFLAVERLKSDGSPFSPEPVVIVSLGP